MTVSGGLKHMPYRVSLGYTNQEGIVKTSNFERFTASVNVAPSFFNDYLKFNGMPKQWWLKTAMPMVVRSELL